LHRAFPLDVPMVLSSALTVTADGERLSCGGFSLGETICFGSLKFIIDLFGGLSLSSLGDGSDAIVMGSTSGRPPSPLWATMGDSTEEFHMTLDGEGPTSSLLGGTTRGLDPPPPQPYHGRRALRPLELR
jgi:hypothetical protein